MKCDLAGMNGCHDPSNDCLIIIFIFSRLVAGAYVVFFTYVVVNGRDDSFAAIIFYFLYFLFFIIILTLVR